VAAVGGLAEGVGKYLEQLRLDFTRSLVLTGCRDVAAVGPHILFNGGGR